VTVGLAELKARLDELGLLLLSDGALPSAVGLVCGPIKGSWWAHPRGGEAFNLLQALEDEVGALDTRLVNAKVTFVAPRLWPAVAALGLAREAWQTRGLAGEAAALLARVDAEGEVLASGKPAKELELRLLVQSCQVHTSGGAHKKQLRRWDRFVADRGLGPLPDAERARDAVAAAAARLEREAAQSGGGAAQARLPWVATGR
jgi:hypothetical protein